MRVELGGAEPAGGVEEPARREAGQEHEARTRRDRPERRVRGRVDVEQRQRRHQPVVGGEPHPVREPLPRHHVREVRLHHELRPPGGARRGDHHRDVGLVDARPDRCPSGRRRGERAPATSVRRRRSRPAPAATCCTNPASSASVLCGIHRYLDRAHLHEREPAAAGSRRCCAAITSTRSPRSTPAARSAARAARSTRSSASRVGQLAVVGVQPRLVGNVVDRRSEQRRDRPGQGRNATRLRDPSSPPRRCTQPGSARSRRRARSSRRTAGR